MRLHSYHPSIVRDVGQQSQWDAGDPARFVGRWCVNPDPFIIQRAMPQRRRVTCVCQNELALARVPSHGNHRRIVDLTELFSNCLVEIAHESNLLHRSKVLLHQLLQPFTNRFDGQAVPAHVGKCDTAHEAAGADGHVMDVAPTVARLLGFEMNDIDGRVLTEILA